MAGAPAQATDEVLREGAAKVRWRFGFEQQRRATDVQAKEAWERIVVGYLELAEIARRQERDIGYSAAETSTGGL